MGSLAVNKNIKKITFSAVSGLRHQRDVHEEYYASNAPNDGTFTGRGTEYYRCHDSHRKHGRSSEMNQRRRRHDEQRNGRRHRIPSKIGSR